MASELKSEGLFHGGLSGARGHREVGWQNS